MCRRAGATQVVEVHIGEPSPTERRGHEALDDDPLRLALTEHVDAVGVELGAQELVLDLLWRPVGGRAVIPEREALGLAAIERPRLGPRRRFAEELGEEESEHLGRVEVVLSAAGESTPADVKGARPSSPEHGQPVLGVAVEAPLDEEVVGVEDLLLRGTQGL